MAFPGGSEGKVSACNVGDPGLIPGLGRCPGEGNGNPFQYSCLENSMVRRAWRTVVHGITKSWTQLSELRHTHTLHLITAFCYISEQLSITHQKAHRVKKQEL